MKRVFNTNDFVSKAREIHGGDTYDYGKVTYVTGRTPVTLKCNRCQKEFTQTPHCHLAYKGCPFCRKGILATESTESFVSKLVAIHGDVKYDYTRVKYEHLRSDLNVGCNTCGGDFQIKAYRHINGYGCRRCHNAPDEALKTKSFIVKAKGLYGEDLYDYSQVRYTLAHAKVIIGCKRCGRSMHQIPTNHITGRGCGHCGNGAQKTNEEYIAEVTKRYGTDAFDYTRVRYTSAHDHVEIGCKRCGLFFSPTAASHLRGTGCPHCLNKTETKLYEWLLAKYPHFTIQRQYRVLTQGRCKYWRNPYDFIIVELNLIIELDGEQHFKRMGHWDPPEKTMRKDVVKTIEANNAGISTVRISQEEVWLDKGNWETKLTDAIRAYSTPTNIFLHETKYLNHQQQLYWASHVNLMVKGDTHPWYQVLRSFISNLGVRLDVSRISLASNDATTEFVNAFCRALQLPSAGSLISDLSNILVSVLGVATEITEMDNIIDITLDPSDSIYHRLSG